MIELKETAPELVTFGETMALMLPQGNKGIEYSAGFASSFGGAESNVAIGVSRLGHRAGWFGGLGKDPLGSLILKKIRGEGVDVSRAFLSKEAPTGLMLREKVMDRVSVYYYRRNSAASAMKPEQLDEAYIKQAKILHVTGITPALSASCKDTIREAIRLARKNGVKVCFDPNLRLKLWSMEEARPVLLELAKEADYFLPGLDELQLLYETEDFAEIVQRLSELQAVSIVKGGDQDTYVIERGEVAVVPCFKVDKVVDTVGAGDGFCAGFISGLLKGYSYEEAVRIGNFIGSVVVQNEGDWEGIPTWEQVEAALNHEKHIER
jgi:2-dehydro-3-deoxygluconokinase